MSDSKLPCVRLVGALQADTLGREATPNPANAAGQVEGVSEDAT